MSAHGFDTALPGAVARVSLLEALKKDGRRRGLSQAHSHLPAFSPDWTRLVTGFRVNTVKNWIGSIGACLQTVKSYNPEAFEVMLHSVSIDSFVDQ